MEIINVGVYPPPYGGVTIHLQRLEQYLDGKNRKNRLYDISNINSKTSLKNNIYSCDIFRVLIKVFFIKKAIVNFHFFSISSLFILFILGVRHVTIISFHNERFVSVLEKFPKILKYIAVFILNSLNYVIVDSEKCRVLAESIILDKQKILVIPEFIPPVHIPETLDQKIVEFRKRCEFLIVSNAYAISFYNGEDLYGIDQLVELLYALRENNFNVGICFLLPNMGDEQYFKLINERIEEKGLKKDFLFITEALDEASSLYRIADLVIRATNTDGNSITIYEALSLGIPVLASDCVPRPEGTLMYKTRNLDDMFGKTIEIIKNINEIKNNIKNLEIQNNALVLDNFFQSISSDK